VIRHTPSTYRTVSIPSTHSATNLERLFSLPQFQRDAQILRLEGRDRLSTTELRYCLTKLPHRIRILSLVGSSLPFPQLAGFLFGLLEDLPAESTLKAIYTFSAPQKSGLDCSYLRNGPYGTSFWVRLVQMANERGILLDAAACPSPLHNPDWSYAVSDQLANVRLPKPCAGCKKSDSAERPVLKMPVPLETANLNAACLPLHHRDSEKRATDTSSYRCYTCCEGRVCARCEKWWCEECLPGYRDVNLLRRTPGGG